MASDKINSNEVKNEVSAMALVLCKGKILSTNELIYDNERWSVPKGHQEEGEKLVETAIRECFEETNVVITKDNLKKELPHFSYEFLTPNNTLIRKTIAPFIFEVEDEGNPLAKEKRILAIEWLNIEEFLDKCSYENVKAIVRQI